MKQLKFQTISILASLALFFFGASAHAITIDPSTLDIMQTTTNRTLGILNWPGVTMTLTRNYGNVTAAQLDVKSPVRLETSAYLVLDQPHTAALSRIVTAADGTLHYEHVDLMIDSIIPTMEIASRSTVRLTEIAQLDPKIERAHRIPIYAFRSSDNHVMVLARAGGQAIARHPADDNGSCGDKCVFDVDTWSAEMVTLDLAKDHPVAQVHGDVEFDDAPKGESNDAHQYVINASYTQTSRDPAPVVAITMRTMKTVFHGESDEE